MDDIDCAIASFPDVQAGALRDVRTRLKTLLPHATEDLSWGMPSLRCHGILVVSYSGFAQHNSLFPGPDVQHRLGEMLEGYTTTKGTIHFDRDKAPPMTFLRALIKAKITSINQSFPKKSGEFLALYDNGAVKSRGRYTAGEMTGAWKFFRRDGSLLREGSFANGKQKGPWTTFTPDGTPHKTTNFA